MAFHRKARSGRSVKPSIFDTAELGQTVSDEVYAREVPQLRTRLLQVQFDLTDADFPVILLFAGVDKAGKRELSNLLSSWMDPRLLVTRAFRPIPDEERAHPRYWRFWQALPPKGRMGIMLSAWYSRPLVDRAMDRISRQEFEEALDEAVNVERTLTDDGALLIKCWMHLGREEQKARLEELEADPLQHWRVSREDWKNWKKYDDFVAAGEQLIARTSTGTAPWTVIEGFDPNYRSLMVGTLVHDRIRRHLAERDAARKLAETRAELPPILSLSGLLPPEAPAEGEEPPEPVTILSTLDMDQKLSKRAYKKQLKELQARLAILHRQAEAEGLPMALVFEGWDAAGKGGAIRRLTQALDARNYEVLPVAAPTQEELSHHYLWRFWRQIPSRSRVTIFDRSWYGRVLVERVEGFATDEEWRRAYREINEFERQLAEFGTVVVKFWVHITKEEQGKRFEARMDTPFKSWKLTDEDWRNRDRWNEYAQAVHEMVQLTSTPEAPWVLVEGNDKRHARIRVLQAVCDALEGALESPPKKLLKHLAKDEAMTAGLPEDDEMGEEGGEEGNGGNGEDEENGGSEMAEGNGPV